MSDLLEVSPEQRFEEFYNDPFFFSYSSLKMLIWSPGQFKKKYIDKIYEDKMEKHLIDGKVVHCLLLNNHLFEQMFIVSPTNLPTGNTKYVVDTVFKHHQALLEAGTGTPTASLEDYEDAIISVLSDISLHQSLKTDSQRVAKICTEEAKEYWEYLSIKQGRDVIDQETLDRCTASAELIRGNALISNLMGMNVIEFDNVEVLNEVEYRINLNPKYPFGLKGIIDNLVIDHDIKKIRINDVKNLSKNLDDFQDSVNFYKYWLQAVVYASLVVIHHKALFDAGYQLEIRFIVIDGNQQMYPFLVTTETLNKWFKDLDQILTTANYHYSNRNYDLPYAFAEGLVTL